MSIGVSTQPKLMWHLVTGDWLPLQVESIVKVPSWLGDGFKYFSFSAWPLGKWSNLTSNHHDDVFSKLPAIAHSSHLQRSYMPQPLELRKGPSQSNHILVIFDDIPRQYHSVFDTCIMSSYSLVYYTNPFLSILIFFIFFLWRLSPYFPQRTLHLEQADDWTTRRIIIVGDTNRTFGASSIQDPPGYLVDRWMIGGLDEVENIHPWKLRNSQASHILWWPLFIIHQKESERLVHLKITQLKRNIIFHPPPFFWFKMLIFKGEYWWCLWIGGLLRGGMCFPFLELTSWCWMLWWGRRGRLPLPIWPVHWALFQLTGQPVIWGLLQGGPDPIVINGVISYKL